MPCRVYVLFPRHTIESPFLSFQMLGISEDRKRPTPANFLAGSLAGLTGQSLCYPLDRARAVMAVTKVGEYKNLWAVFRRISVEEGLLAFYTGFRPAMGGVILYAGTSFYTFETLKFHVQEARGAPETSFWERQACGSLAGLAGQFMSYPLEIVRRRMQTARQMGLGANKYTSIAGTLIEVLRYERLEGDCDIALLSVILSPTEPRASSAAGTRASA